MEVYFAGRSLSFFSFPTQRAIVGTVPRVTARRTGSVNLHISQATAKVPTVVTTYPSNFDEEVNKKNDIYHQLPRGFSRIYPGREVLPVTLSNKSQTWQIERRDQQDANSPRSKPLTFLTASMGSTPKEAEFRRLRSNAKKIDPRVVA